MKVDMHLHSKYSKRPSQWVLQKIGCPESFAEPMMLNRLRQKAGMDAFTLTDHNIIDGALEIAHLPNTFISEEVTTYFPEDGCKVHVLVYDINESIHEDIQKIRKNIYELVSYLDQTGVIYSVAHCLFSINDRLTMEHFEKFLLLFKYFEMNGARDNHQNLVIKAVLENLKAGDIEFLANKHDMSPAYPEPHVKYLSAGSDDHSALNVARMYTEVPGATNLKEFFQGLKEGRSIAAGDGATPLTLAHNLYGIAYQFYNSRLNFDRYVNHDILMRFLDRLLKPEPKAQTWFPFVLTGMFDSRRRRRIASSKQVEDVLRKEGEQAILDDPELKSIIRSGARFNGEKDECWFKFVDKVCNKVMQRLGSALYNSLSGGNLINVFTTIGAAGSIYTLMAPYFISFGLYGRDRKLQDHIESVYDPSPQSKANASRVKVAHFTDTFYEINGVAWTLRRMAELASEKNKDLTIITCSTENAPKNMTGVKNFNAIDTYELPMYPEQKLFLPPFLEILRHVYEEGYTYIHSATPGPLGLVALAVARILNLPISGTYHTAIPEYASHLTNDENVTGLTWRYVLWYYEQMEKLYAPSYDTAAMLVSKGLDSEKIVIYPRGVDTDRFDPKFMNGFYESRYGIGKKAKLLYVGRVSKEKNMPLLANAYKKLCQIRDDLQLVIVGDGPYLEQMKKDMAKYPVTFTGFLKGRELSEAYASADLFLFPSTTDTFGNVILEAQASGLPVVVTDAGGPRENIIEEKTGVVIRGDDESALVESVMELVESPLKLKQMSKEARSYAESRSFENAFLEHWKLYAQESEEFSPLFAKAS